MNSTTFRRSFRALAPVVFFFTTATAVLGASPFSDDPIVPGVTAIKAIHILELRTAVDDVRAAASLAPGSYTDASLADSPIKTIHVLELRNALSEARAALGMSAVTFTDASLTTDTAVKAVHIQELRDAARSTLLPSITSFTAVPGTVPPHAPVQLAAVFSGGTAVISNNVNATTITPATGVPVTVTVDQNTTYTLTVTDVLGDPVTANASVTTLMPTVALTRPAAGTTTLTAADDFRCTPGPCPDTAPLLYALSAATTAVDGSLVTFLLNGSPLGSAVAASSGLVESVARSIANGPAQQLSVQVIDPFGNTATSPAITVEVNSVPPAAANDQYNVRQGNALNAAAPGVFSNDLLGHGTSITGYGSSVGNEQTAIGWPTATSGGGVVIVNADGSLAYTPSSSSFTGTDTFKYTIANVSGTSVGSVSIFVYSQNCGLTAPTVTFAPTPGALPFDPQSIVATAQSIDDDPAICPSEFANSIYTFNWSVTSGGPYAFDSISATSGTTSQAIFRTGSTGGVVLRTTAIGNRSSILGAAPLLVGGCANPYPTVGFTYTAFDPQVGPLLPGAVFYRDDTITLAGSFTFPCESDPRPALNWTLSSGDGALLSSTTTATPYFKVATPGMGYNLTFGATDRWGYAGYASNTLVSSFCGAYAPQVTVVASNPPRPLDPVLLSASVESPDNTQCPSRFADMFSFDWSISPANGSTLSVTNAPSTIFTPAATGTYNVSLKVTTQLGISTTTDTFVFVACGAAPTSSVVLTSNAPAAVGSTVTLANITSDPCLTSPNFTYTWLLSPPPGDTTAIVPSGSTASFTPQSVGTYTVTGSAVDSMGIGSSPVSIAVDTCPAPTSSLQVTSASPATVGSTVTLHDTAMSYCSASPAFQYSWTVYPKDDGTTIVPTDADAFFIPHTATTYVVTVTATEPSGGATTRSISVAVQ